MAIVEECWSDGANNYGTEFQTRKEEKVIANSQHGFMKGKSYMTNLTAS